MGGIKQSIKVEGRLCWTLFDTGARSAQLVGRPEETASDKVHNCE